MPGTCSRRRATRSPLRSGELPTQSGRQSNRNARFTDAVWPGLVLRVLAFTQEIGYGTITSTFLVEPRRTRALVSKGLTLVVAPRRDVL